MSSADERRTESRLLEQATIFLELLDSGNDSDKASVIICNSIDISASGIQVQVDNSLAQGTIIRLCAGFLDQDLYLVSEVKWSRPDGEQFNIGLEIYEAEDTDIIGWKNLIAAKLGDQNKPLPS